MLERHLAPHGAVVRSPDFILDRVSGSEREVDASIRYQVGSAPVLITIECRDRNRLQDKPWIEQIAQKQRDIGANLTIVVTRTGLFEPAIKAARHHGIEVRTFAEVDAESVRQWGEDLQLVYIHGSFGLGKCSVHFHNDPGDALQPHPQVLQDFAGRLAETAILRRVVGRQRVSIRDLLTEDERRLGQAVVDLWPSRVDVEPEASGQIIMNVSFPSLFANVPITGEVVTKMRQWVFEQGELEMRTTEGYRSVSSLEVEINLKYSIFPVALGKGFAYTKPEGMIAHLERREVILGPGKTRTFYISGRHDSGNDDGLTDDDPDGRCT